MYNAVQCRNHKIDRERVLRVVDRNFGTALPPQPETLPDEGAAAPTSVNHETFAESGTSGKP